MASAVATRLDAIRDRGGIKSREVAELLDTTPQTVSRWRSGKVEPHSERLHRLLALEWLIGELAEFYPPDEARLWLFSPTGYWVANVRPTASSRARPTMS